MNHIRLAALIGSALCMLAGCAGADRQVNYSSMAAVTQSTGNFAASSRTSKDSGDITSVWMTALSAGGPATLDAATVQNPDTQITGTTTVELDCSNWFSQDIAFRLGYTGTPSASLVGQVWGRTSTTEAWTPLPNLNGDVNMTFTANTVTDATDGTLYYTRVDPILHVVNRMGCNYLRFGVNTAFNGTVTNTSILQAKAVR